jgi:TfoX/Sxy family transcriptional regulator of competence genes
VILELARNIRQGYLGSTMAMPDIRTPETTDADMERFRTLIPDGADIEIKAMFGGLAAFVNGNIFAAFLGASIGVKLSEGDQEKLLGEKGAGPFGPPGRTMGGYVALPGAWSGTPTKARHWMNRALEHARALPLKKKAGNKK